MRFGYVAVILYKYENNNNKGNSQVAGNQGKFRINVFALH
ncbi:Unannotated [Lentimonas sp. CC19]|nr:Unannotated [Lentimonas sp. CC10]CAA6697651.1 Unannotated [Lentimonas sp. CC19]CAA7071483.1 Unannotated [Lentimonas sp. CC11]